MAWSNWKNRITGRNLLIVAGSCLLAIPIIALALDLFLHWLRPPFPQRGSASTPSGELAQASRFHLAW